MSQKNQIDELFRQGLGNKGLDYSPKHWEQMDALIKQRKNGRLKRGMWISAALLFFISLVFILNHTGKEGLKSEKEKVSETQKSAPIIQNGTEQPLGTKNPDAPLTEEEPIENAPKPITHATTRKGIVSSEKPPIGPKEVLHDQETEFQGPLKDRGSIIQDKNIDGAKYEFEEKDLAQNPLIERVQQPSLLFPSIQSRNLVGSFSALLNKEAFMQNRSIPIREKGRARRLPSYRQWYVETYFNYGRVKHRNDKAIEMWKASNEMLGSFSHYGINLRVAMRRFSLKTGLGIQQWVEYTNYTRLQDQYTFDTSFQLAAREYIQRPDGSYAALLSRKIDTLSHTTSVEKVCENCPVNFRYVTVPIALYYELGRGRWLGFVETGMTFSFLSKASGTYGVEWTAEQGKNAEMRLSPLNESHFSKVLMHGNLMLGMKYRVHPFVSLGCRFSYQRSLQSMMTLYRQEPDFYGFGFGVEWMFH